MLIYMQNVFFSDNLLNLSDHVIDHALNWKKYDHSSYKIKTYYKTPAFSSKTFTLPGYMSL